MVNMLTYFVNVHAHSSTSIKHTMISVRVTGTIANKTEEITQYLKKGKNFVVLEMLPKDNILPIQSTQEIYLMKR